MRKSLIILLLICGISSISAESVNITAFLEETNSVLYWDPFRNIAYVWKGKDVVSFKPGNTWALLNFKKKIVIDPVHIEKGILFLPSATYGVFASLFERNAENKDARRIAAVFLDPGHGGIDPGTTGTHTVDGKEVKIREKDLVLQVSQDVAEMLAATYPDTQIILSREKDEYVSLEDRTEIANDIEVEENETIIFISIHANASFNKKASGYEIWYLPPEYRRELIDSESIDKEYEDILPILNSMKEEEYTVESVLLAQNILNALDTTIGEKTINRGIKQETWYVVRQAKMPSILIEIGFVTNYEEFLLLRDDAYLNKLSEGIYNGIKTFIQYVEDG